MTTDDLSQDKKRPILVVVRLVVRYARSKKVSIRTYARNSSIIHQGSASPREIERKKNEKKKDKI